MLASVVPFFAEVWVVGAYSAILENLCVYNVLEALLRVASKVLATIDVQLLYLIEIRLTNFRILTAFPREVFEGITAFVHFALVRVSKFCSKKSISRSSAPTDASQGDLSVQCE